MSNRHIKTINGRRYYYESIRRGKKVTSRYIGPVDERKRKPRKAQAEQEIQPVAQQQVQEQSPASPEEGYIG